MGWTMNGLINLAKHIDLPGHDQVISKVRLYVNLSSALIALTAALFWSAVAWWLMRFEAPVYVGFAGALLVPLFIWCRYDDDLALWCSRRSKKTIPVIAGILAIAGFGLGGYVGYINYGEADRLSALLCAFAGAIAGGLVGSLGVTILWLLVRLALAVALIPGLVITPVLSLVSYAFGRHLRKHHPEWRADDDKLLVKFVGGRISVGGTSKNVYVVDPALRRNGQAEQRKIPRFTYSQLVNERNASVKLTNAAIAAAAASGMYIATGGSAQANQNSEAGHDLAGLFGDTFNASSLETPVFNPTTGLPMVGNTPGGIDVGGNLYGQADSMGSAMNPGGGYSAGGMDSGGGMNQNQW